MQIIEYEGRQYMPSADWARRENLHRNRAYTLIHAGVVRYITSQKLNMTTYYVDVTCKAPPILAKHEDRNRVYRRIREEIGQAFVGRVLVMQATAVAV